MDNLTIFTEFLLMDVTGSRELQVLQVEIALLVVMSYDRYVAICHPLHYRLIITPSLCSQATACSWASGLIYSASHTGALFSLPFTNTNVIQQYFCDIPQIVRISSPKVQFSEFVVIVMNSVEARNKAISTCTPQLAILLLVVISGAVAVLGPIAKKPSLKNLLNAVFYTTVPPFMNPIIYSLRQSHTLQDSDVFHKQQWFNCIRTAIFPAGHQSTRLTEFATTPQEGEENNPSARNLQPQRRPSMISSAMQVERDENATEFSFGVQVAEDSKSAKGHRMQSGF
ncbi:Olfactory receptor 14I1 [Fukomys damarensis]|uniref:Olfactory receptor 14I1 n=1 Tax=Fukomys damarensis TaxID=885580 RepID=A0A091EQ75_FUKDA|nr:Olfactory receptor 14I1 [Fukomys damarensis]